MWGIGRRRFACVVAPAIHYRPRTEENPARMQQALESLQNRLAPAEEIFFTWLARVFAAGVLVGSAWIDDAPPLALVAMIITLYVGVRVATQFGAFMATAPFRNRALQVCFALVCLILLAGSFAVVAIFVERLAISVAEDGL